MTLGLLEKFGVQCKWKDRTISVEPGDLTFTEYTVGADWSSASYWYAIAFLAKEADIQLQGLKDDWIQGDREVAEWMKRFGVETEFNESGARILKRPCDYPKMMKLNFVNNPDLAQTFAAMFAAENVFATFSGIDSLKVKETDRILALQNELAKVNVHFEYSDIYDFYQLRGTFQVPEQPINTYDDHRMAMSFATLATVCPVVIENPDVVIKSYPGFWMDMQQAGFELQTL